MNSLTLSAVVEKPTRVLLVDTMSGSNDFGVELPIALDPLVDLTVFTVRGTRLLPGDCRNIIAVFPPFGGSSGKLHKLRDALVATLQLARQLWRHRQHVVHVQGFRTIALELPLYVLMRPFLRRLVYTAHNALPHEPRRWHGVVYGLWYRLLDQAHVLSQHTGNQLVARFGFDRARLIYAPHGNYDRFRCDHPPAARDATRSLLGIEREQVLVLMYGLIREYKGIDRLILAAASTTNRRLRILVAGGCVDDLAQHLKDRAAALGLRDRLELLVGFVENQRLSDLVDAADVIAFPYHRISQSGALLLAMTYGKAIIATDLPSFREYLEDGVSGLLMDTSDPPLFARALDGLVADAALRSRLGETARRHAVETFAWTAVARTIVSAYGT